MVYDYSCRQLKRLYIVLEHLYIYSTSRTHITGIQTTNLISLVSSQEDCHIDYNATVRNSVAMETNFVTIETKGDKETKLLLLMCHTMTI